MIFAILAFYFGYKKAKDKDRNPFAWSAIAGFSFIITQLLMGLGLGVAVGIGIVAFGWSEDVLVKYDILFRIFSIAVSIGVFVLVLKILDWLPAGSRRVEGSVPSIRD